MPKAHAKTVNHLSREQNQSHEEEYPPNIVQDSAAAQHSEPPSTPSMTQLTQDHLQDLSTPDLGSDREVETRKLTVTTSNKVDLRTWKIPQINSEVLYLGDPNIMTLDGIDTKINTKGKSIDCYAFAPRARFCDLVKLLSQLQNC